MVGTGGKVPPQFTPIIMMFSPMIFPLLINSLMVIASHGLHETAIFMSLHPSKYLYTNFAKFKVPQWIEPAVLIMSSGSVTKHGTSSTPTTASTAPLSNKCFMIVVTTPPYSPLDLMSSLAE